MYNAAGHIWFRRLCVRVWDKVGPGVHQLPLASQQENRMLKFGS